MNTPRQPRVLVWDWPVRVFHWGLVVAFAGAYVLGDSERWRDVHVALGYAALALIAFRLAWGWIGTRPARFASFLRAPRAVGAYLAAVLRGRPAHHTGHNPAGGWAIALLLALGAATGLSGWLRYQDLGGESLEELHELLANAWLALVAVHIVAVLGSSVLHRENLARAMLTGYKRGVRGEGAARACGGVALALLVAVGALVVASMRPVAPAAATPNLAHRPATLAHADRKGQD